MTRRSDAEPPGRRAGPLEAGRGYLVRATFADLDGAGFAAGERLVVDAVLAAGPHELRARVRTGRRQLGLRLRAGGGPRGARAVDLFALDPPPGSAWLAEPKSDARRLLLAVAALHDRGYEGLRIRPRPYSPEVERLARVRRPWVWRCDVASAAGFAQASFVSYASQDGRGYFGWPDADEATPGELADRFVERFADVAAAGRGDDGAYAAWLRYVLGCVERGMFPLLDGAGTAVRSRVATGGAGAREHPIDPPPAAG